MIEQPPTASTRQIVRVALLIFAVSLGTRLVCVWQAQHIPISDARHYHRRAQIILRHGSMPESAYRTPAYPYFLAGLYKCVGKGWRVPATANALLGAATSALLVLLAATCTDVRAAALAGMLHALSPPALAYVPQTLTEVPSAFLLIGGLLLLAWADWLVGWRRLLVVAGSGLVYGVLLLTRPAGLFFAPAWLLLVLYSPRRREWRPIPAASFVVMTALVLAPWLIRNYRLGFGPLMLSSVGGTNLYIGNNDGAVSDGSMKVDVSWRELREELGEAGADRWARQQACEWIIAHPWRYAGLCRVRALGLVGAKASGYVVRSLAHWFMAPDAFEAYRKCYSQPEQAKTWGDLRARLQARVTRTIEWYYALLSPLILISLVLAAFHWRRCAVALLPVGIYLLALSLTFSQPRFRELSDPLLFVLVAALLVDVCAGTRTMGVRPDRRTKVALVLIGLAIAIAVQASGVSRNWYTLPPMAHSTRSE